MKIYCYLCFLFLVFSNYWNKWGETDIWQFNYCASNSRALLIWPSKERLHVRLNLWIWNCHLIKLVTPLPSSENHLTYFEDKHGFYLMSLMATLISVIPPSEVVLLVFYFLGEKMCWFSPSCSNDHIRIRAYMRILPSAITNISLKNREVIVDGIKRHTKKQAFLDKAILPQNMMSSESVSGIFCDANNLDIFEFSCTIYSRGKKEQWLHLRNSRSKIYGAHLWCFMKCFLRPCCLGNPEIQLKSERPLNWRISLQGTIHLQPLSKDQDGHSSVHFSKPPCMNWPLGPRRGHCLGEENIFTPDTSKHFYFCMFVKSVHSILIRNFWHLWFTFYGPLLNPNVSTNQEEWLSTLPSAWPCMLGSESLASALIFINLGQTKIVFKPNFVQLSETTDRHTSDFILSDKHRKNLHVNHLLPVLTL